MSIEFNHKPKGSVIGSGSYVFRHYGNELATYTITPTLTNVTASASNPTTITENGTATLIFTAASGYVLPDNVTVTGATSSWDKTTGTLVLSNPTGNVTFTITGILPQFETPTITLTGSLLSTPIVEGVTMYKVYDNDSYVGYVDSDNVWHAEVSE